MDLKNQMQKREIKFRAWDNMTKLMYQVRDIDFLANREINSIRLVVGIQISEDDIDFDFPIRRSGEYELMQFTGLLDKNGVEIYEGDIVKYDVYQQRRDDVIKKTDIVKYKDYGFEPFIYHTIIDQDDWYNYELENFEVIGNIYEHSNLLNNG